MCEVPLYVLRDATLTTSRKQSKLVWLHVAAAALSVARPCSLQGYLAHKKQPPPPKNPLGP